MHVKFQTPTDFSKITSPSQLCLYLDDSANRLKNSKYIFHYTSLFTVVKIIAQNCWHLGNASDMNDVLEYKNGDMKRWNNLFFSCFMCEDTESIGMWSMYAQPWEKGVKIALPSKAVRKWVESADELYEISTVDYRPTNRTISINSLGGSIRLSAVAYSNAGGVQEIGDEKITWSNRYNTNLNAYIGYPGLTGYIKDMAWSYEKEIRIKAEFDNTTGIERVALPLSDEILDQMIITAGPMFEGDLREELKRAIENEVGDSKIDALINRFALNQSMFTNRLNIKTVCQKCDIKKIYLANVKGNP